MTRRERLMQFYMQVNLAQVQEESEPVPNTSFIEICQTVRRVIGNDLAKYKDDFVSKSETEERAN